MKKGLVWWQTSGFVFTGILGVLFHFFYNFSNQNVIVALFCPVNESVWEHIKLIFFPMLIFSVIQNRYIGNKYENFWGIKLVGAVIGILLVPVLFYTINGVFANVPDWVNIASFFVSVAAVYYIETKLFKNDCLSYIAPRRAVLFFVLIVALFFIFTFAPPHIPLFEDPITKTYGI